MMSLPSLNSCFTTIKGATMEWYKYPSEASVHKRCYMVVFLCLMFFFLRAISKKPCERTSQTNAWEVPEKRFATLAAVPYTEVQLHPAMSPFEMDAMFYMFISRLHYICKHSKRLGNERDGGWNACLVGPYHPRTPCLVYSFGKRKERENVFYTVSRISNDWSFDDAVVRHFGCTVRSFDPSMINATEHVRHKKIHFYKIGIGGSDFVNTKNWQIKSLPSIVSQMNDVGKVIDYLKFDVEFSEYETIQSFFNNSVAAELLQSLVKQVGFEVHFKNRSPTRDSVPELYNAWNVLSQFEKKLGFRRWYFSFNPLGIYDVQHGVKRSCCYEVVYINQRFLR